MAFVKDRDEKIQQNEAWELMKRTLDMLDANGYYIRKISQFCWGISKKDVWLEIHIWTLENKLQDVETRYIYRYTTQADLLQILNKLFDEYEA